MRGTLNSIILIQQLPHFIKIIGQDCCTWGGNGGNTRQAIHSLHMVSKNHVDRKFKLINHCCTYYCAFFCIMYCCIPGRQLVYKEVSITN